MAPQSMTLPTRKLVGEHVLSEANETRAREHIVLAPTAVALSPGTILGKVTATGLFVPLDPAAVDGSEAFGAVLFDRAPINTANQRRVGHVRDCEINEKKITLVNALDAAQMTTMRTQAKAAGVIFSSDTR